MVGLPLLSNHSEGSPSYLIEYSSLEYLGISFLPSCHVCCSSHKSNSSPAKLILVLPPRVFSSKTKEILPAIPHPHTVGLEMR